MFNQTLPSSYDGNPQDQVFPDLKETSTYASPVTMSVTNPYHSNLSDLSTEGSSSETVTETRIVLRQKPPSFDESCHDILLENSQNCSDASLPLSPSLKETAPKEFDNHCPNEAPITAVVALETPNEAIAIKESLSEETLCEESVVKFAGELFNDHVFDSSFSNFNQSALVPTTKSIERPETNQFVAKCEERESPVLKMKRNGSIKRLCKNAFALFSGNSSKDASDKKTFINLKKRLSKKETAAGQISSPDVSDSEKIASIETTDALEQVSPLEVDPYRSTPIYKKNATSFKDPEVINVSELCPEACRLMSLCEALFSG